MSAQNTAQVLTFESGPSDDHDKPVFIDPGTYEAVLVNWKVYYSRYFKKGTLRMRFRITEPGKFHDLVIPGWFNVEPSISRTAYTGITRATYAVIPFAITYIRCVCTRHKNQDQQNSKQTFHTANPTLTLHLWE